MGVMLMRFLFKVWNMNPSRNKLDKMLQQARERQGKYNRDIFRLMTTEQLRELAADEPPSDERIKEIFASVNALHLLE